MNFKTFAAKRIALIVSLTVSAILVSAAALPPPDKVAGYVNENLRTFIGTPADPKIDSKTSPTPLGSATADAARLAASAELAIINGGVFQQNLFSGQRTYGDVCDVFSADDGLGLASVTPEQLYGILEAGVSKIMLDITESIVRDTAYGGFPQVSGFSFVYDATAKPGGRVNSVTLQDGTVLDREDGETHYLLAASVTMLDGDYGMPVLPYTPVGMTLSQALAAFITSGFNAADYNRSDSSRIRVLGTSQSKLLHGTSGGWIVVCAALLIAAIVAGKSRYNRLGSSGNMMYPPQ